MKPIVNLLYYLIIIKLSFGGYKHLEKILLLSTSVDVMKRPTSYKAEKAPCKLIMLK
jgi:hypothetical protein